MDHLAGSWLERRTYRAEDFPLTSLLAAKGSTRISVVIPARNEADTIGPIVAAIRHELMSEHPLVDELHVIDSDSTDATAKVAAASGAHVHSAAAIALELGWLPGKGEAMWKSLFVANGDLIAFIDADLTSFEVSYVTGLIGPLLHHEQIQLVKGFYERDLGLDARGASQGGRVTELMARPLINLWWPELRGVIQPLAGEWAARRRLLEQMPFPCGYGVECAVLVDAYRTHGLDAIAQVDLGRRAHLHQDLASLGVMAAEVLAAAENRRFGEPVGRGSTISHPSKPAPGVDPVWATRQANTAERPAFASICRPDRD